MFSGPGLYKIVINCNDGQCVQSQRKLVLQTRKKQHVVVFQGCGRGATCGFKHMIIEPPEAPQGEHRNVDTGPQPRRGDPSAQGRGRGPRDGPLPSSRSVHSFLNYNATESTHPPSEPLCLIINIEL